MKEFTIEQKAKAYDEALKKLKILHDDWATTQNRAAKEVEEIFAELKESKESGDEEIRKEMLQIAKESEDSFYMVMTPGKRKRLIAWLEKQQKPAESIKEYDFHGIKFVPKFAKGDIIKDKKRGEVSTIKDFSYDTGLYTHTYGQFPITIQDNYEIIEPKQEWGKQDETLLNCCLGAINTTDYFDKDNKDEMKNWLMFLKERVQSKQGCGEEEQQIIKDAASFILSCVNTVETKEEEERLEELADKLQDLRPQSQCKPSDELDEASYQTGIKRVLENLESYGLTKYNWKPSDNQMDALDYYANSLCTYSDRQSDLRSLFNDLKKLRGK